MKTESVSPTKDVAAPPLPVAVIDIGATSLRMQVSEIHADGTIRKLESFSQAISLGKDSFIKGRIETATIEDCVHVLRIYRDKLDEYGIKDNRQIRVVATSAVKEAENRLAFQDRIYIATGFEVELLDEAELHRITYLGVLPFVEMMHEEFENYSLICEVGGGTTEIVLFRRDEVVFSQTYRQGSLRLERTLGSFETQTNSSIEILQSQIMNAVQQIQKGLGEYEPVNMIALGGDVRFAANELAVHPSGNGLARLDLDKLVRLTKQILSQSTHRLVSKYRLSIPEADALGPALLTYVTIAKELKIKSIFVADFNLRDGLVKELAGGGKWSESIQRQVIRSAIQMGRKFHIDSAHAIHVSKLACKLFEQLRELHQLSDRFSGILEMAAILHEVGIYVSPRSYHKHSLYLIRHAEFFGITAKDVELMGLVARYHRRATPQPNHEGYSALDRKDRVAVAKLAAILRIAKALDATRTQRIKDIQCKRYSNQLHIVVSNIADISLELLEIRRSRSFFNEVFGTQVVLETNQESL
jgi:exopolyphosphatase/guanosine-5'-triphosphate,3'-diphosphate pyrophosphatase